MADSPFQTFMRDFPALYAPYDPGSRAAMPDKLYRYMELDGTRAQEPDRSVEAVLSSETPVFRGGFTEVLRHDEASVDMSRAADGLPLLWSHDTSQQIGAVSKIRVYDGKLRGRLQFSESALGAEKFRDVQQGILKGISIGYKIEAVESRTLDDSREEITATRWMPFEVSAVTVPADISAGIGRSLEAGYVISPPADLDLMDNQNRELNIYRTLIEPIASLPEVKTAVAEFERRLPLAKTPADFADLKQLRIAIIEVARSHPDVHSDRGILSYRQKDSTMKTDQFFPSIMTSGNRGDDPDQFSLCRALSMQFDPATARIGGPEIEIMADAQRTSCKAKSDRSTIPEDVLFRTLDKAGTGGNLIGIDHMGGSFVPALRSRLITGNMGATILSGLTADIELPRSISDAETSWIAGDGADQISESTPTYDKISMKPKTLGSFTIISRKALLQGDPASESLVRDSLAYAVSKALDTAAINGDGTGNVPVGIMNQTGVFSGTYTTAPTFGDLVDMEGALMVDDAAQGQLGYVTTGLLTASLKQTPIVSAQDTMVWTVTDQGEGRINGYRSMTSNLIPVDHILFGNWSDLLIALWSGIDFLTDPYSRSSYGDVVISVYQDVDISVRHGESFAVFDKA